MTCDLYSNMAPTYEEVDKPSEEIEMEKRLNYDDDMDEMYAVVELKQDISKIPQKEKEMTKNNVGQDKLTALAVFLILLAVTLSIITTGLLTALIISYINVLNLEPIIDSSIAASSSAADGTPPGSHSELLDASNTTTTQLKLDMLRASINDMFLNFTSDIAADTNNTQQRIDTLSSSMETLHNVVALERASLVEKENATIASFVAVMSNITSELNSSRQNFTETLSRITQDTQAKLDDIRSVLNQTLLMEQPNN